jgi:hypothetical protein
MLTRSDARYDRRISMLIDTRIWLVDRASFRGGVGGVLGHHAEPPRVS